MGKSAIWKEMDQNQHAIISKWIGRNDESAGNKVNSKYDRESWWVSLGESAVILVYCMYMVIA